MGREIRRVPADFDWPIGKTWQGFLMPESLHEKPCKRCGSTGYSDQARVLMGKWYGNAPFEPAESGSEPFTFETPEVRAFAERNVAHSPEYYGSGERAIRVEAQRLAYLFNSQWNHHLTQEDVDVLVAEGRLMEFTHTWDKEKRWQPRDPMPKVTAEQVNHWSILGFGHDAINCGYVIRERCRRDGVPETCVECRGHGYQEAYEGQREDADAWTATQPPTGDCWQLWETVSEGSPISPVFTTPEDLARWMVSGQSEWMMPTDYDAALRFVNDGWAPSLAYTAETGLVDGVTFVGGDR